MKIDWNNNNRMHFEQFRSEICHLLKSLNDTDFVVKIIKEKWIETFWKWGWKEESLYVLALLDYLSDLYQVEPFTYYDWYRNQKLDNVLYPQSILIEDHLKPEQNIKEKVIKKCQQDYCSSFFIKYNIVEGDIRNVA